MQRSISSLKQERQACISPGQITGFRSSKLDQLQRENAVLLERLQQVEQIQSIKERIEDKAAMVAIKASQ
jgi:hypothetical protein